MCFLGMNHLNLTRVVFATEKPVDPVKQEEVAEPSPVESKPTSQPEKQTHPEMEEPEDVLVNEHGRGV